MNRMYTQFRLGLEKRMVDLYCSFAVGATGAPTLSAANSKGITSVTRNSAGKYTIVLQDAYVDLFSAIPSILLASGSPAAITMVVRSKTLTGASPSVAVEFLDSTGTAVEVANGAAVVLKLEMKASTV